MKSIRLLTHYFFAPLLLSLFFLLFSQKLVFADTASLTGTVKDSAGSAISNATVSVNNASNDSTVTDINGTYTLQLESGTYNIQVTPPAGSNFTSAIALSQNIVGNTILDFILTPAGTVELRGHIYDASGSPLPNQTIFLQATNGTIISTITDNNGNYSLQVAPGNYTNLEINVNSGGGNDTASHVPQYYRIYKSNYTLNQSTILDITIPAKQVIVHVQDQNNNPVENVEVNAKNLTDANSGGLNIGGGIIDASGKATYLSTPLRTDDYGNVTLWLLPTSPNLYYILTAIPPSGSSYITTTHSNVSFIENTSVTIELQQPVTLSGHVYGPLGNPLPNQNVSLINSSGNPVTSTVTDNGGGYSLTAAPDTYAKLEISKTSGSGNLPELNVPQYYNIFVSNYPLVENTTLDITIPAKKITVHVQDAIGSGIEMSEITARESHGNLVNVNGLSIGGTITNASGYSNYFSPSVQTDSFGNAAVWLLPTNQGHTYVITANAPSGSNFQSTDISNVSVVNDKNETIILQQPTTLSGHIYGPLGNPLPNQTIMLNKSSGSPITATTDSSGSFSLQALSGVVYQLEITVNSGMGNDASLSAPQYYRIYKSNYTLNQNTNLDITIPAKQVIVHVQDQNNNPVENVEVNAKNLTDANSGGLNIGGGIIDASGKATYLSTPLRTDDYGNVTLWLLPTSPNLYYILTAIPPIGSSYNTFIVNNISVLDNKTEIISLQYNHATPVTTATLETEHADGTYSNPTTVTLSATAAAGYTVAHTYYKVDGGAQQTYTNPFTVSGTEDHAIEYWSVDNVGVQEAHKTKPFTIYTNQAPYVDPLPNVTINRGQTYTATGSFTDPDSASWTATVDYDDGAGEEPLTLNPDKTFTLSHQYNTANTYHVRVVVRDNQQATGTTQATVTVVVPEPVTATFNSSADTYVKSGSDNRNTGAGTFMRLQASGDNRSLVRFDQSAMQNTIGNKQVLSAKLRVTITDNGNNWGTTGRTIDVHRLLSNWTEGNGTENNRGTGSGATWECATDTIIENQAKNCSGTTEWEMGQPNNPSVHPWVQTATATQTITNNQTGIVEFDVTSDVTSFLNGTNQNNGWIIKKTVEGQNGQVSFGTKESLSVPQLVVTYQP